MRSIVTFAAGALMLAISMPATAQEFKLHADLFGQKKPAPPRPPTVDWNRQPSQDRKAPARPSVICGMTVVPADPTIDPKIRVTPRDTGVKYTLKVVEPTVCKP